MILVCMWLLWLVRWYSFVTVSDCFCGAGAMFTSITGMCWFLGVVYSFDFAFRICVCWILRFVCCGEWAFGEFGIIVFGVLLLRYVLQ